LGEQFSKALCAFSSIWAIHLPLQTLFVGPFVGVHFDAAVVPTAPVGIKKAGVAGSHFLE
jgi:hypothetical protein